MPIYIMIITLIIYFTYLCISNDVKDNNSMKNIYHN